MTATRAIAEAWEREVRRIATRTGLVRAEARIRQSLDGSIGAAALTALERALERGVPGWEPLGDVYRHNVDGGYALYSMADRSLTIVATEVEELRIEERATAQVTGRIDEVFTGHGVGRYYDDRYGGTSPELAAEQARLQAEAAIQGAVQHRIDSVVQDAEAALGADLQAEAERRAQADYDARYAARSAAVQRDVQARAVAIGAEARRAFHTILAGAYRDALLAMARHRGAQEIRCSEDGDVLEIEMMLPR